jgi:hypothetical protein
MANETELLSLSKTHMGQQVRDVAVIQYALSVAFDRTMTPNDLDAGFERFLQYAVRLITAGRAKGTLSADRFYAASRVLAGLSADLPTATVPALLELGTVETSMRVTGPVRTKKLIANGKSPAAALAQAKVATLGAAKRQVLNAPRERIVSLTENDDDALAWARQSDGNPCAFCAMLISRGPVYSAGTVAFMAHDECGCMPRSVFKSDRSRGWDSQSLALRKLYDENPGDKFRHAYEHREAA